MTKEILIDILNTNGNLYIVIDKLLELQYDQGYNDKIQEIYELSYNATKVINTESWLLLLSKLIPFTISSLVFIGANWALFSVSHDEELLHRMHGRIFANTNMSYDGFLSQLEIGKNLCRKPLTLIEIVIGLSTFKDKLYTTKEFQDLYIENIASFIHSEMLLGNINSEFIAYINTFLG